MAVAGIVVAVGQQQLTEHHTSSRGCTYSKHPLGRLRLPVLDDDGDERKCSALLHVRA